jgi:hypothetical protein
MLEATRPARAAELAPAGEFTDARVRLHAFYTPDPHRLVVRRNRLFTYALTGILLILLLGFAARSVIDHYYPPRPALVEFDVKPRGEIVIDGVLRGKVPPLRVVEVEAGRHRILVRNGKAPPLLLNVDLQAGERMAVSHTFGEPPAPPKPGGFWRNLRRQFGF